MVESLAESCALLLGEHGRLSRVIPGFVVRKEQSELAAAIAKAIEDKDILVAEAGTGTGKTFAYLLPSLLSGKKVLISTATKTLQDQLCQKDLPMLVKALGLSLRMQNLKGRANYICQYRLNLYAEEGQFQSAQTVHEILQLQAKLPRMKSGERAECTEIKEDSPIWYYVTSTTDNCLGTECPNYDSCFLVKARKRAQKADIVVINHHLFFADSRLKQEGFGELLPNLDILIFDEAHQLAEIAIYFNSERFSTRQFHDLLQDIISEWPILDLPNQPLKSLNYQSEILMGQLVNYLDSVERLSWEMLHTDKNFMTIWKGWRNLSNELSSCFNNEIIENLPGLAKCKARLDEFANFFICYGSQHNKICWVERLKQSLVFHATPYDVAGDFSALLQERNATYIFTSATLSFASSFDNFCRPLGLDKINSLSLASPFNYKKQALLYLPRGLPDPKHITYYDRLLERTIPIIQACGGRCFFLFTSHKALKKVAQLLKPRLDFPLLIQGDEAKSILLSRFKQLGNAILLGTATFWEGVDVKGDSLSCVIIDKIPFANPTDPLIQGKMTYLKNQGLSAFDELSLPNAVIALKQGIGRLIRDKKDKGLLILADPRLTSRDYSKLIFMSLPKIPKTRTESKTLKFISDLDLKNETISD